MMEKPAVDEEPPLSPSEQISIMLEIEKASRQKEPTKRDTEVWIRIHYLLRSIN